MYYSHFYRVLRYYHIEMLWCYVQMISIREYVYYGWRSILELEHLL